MIRQENYKNDSIQRHRGIVLLVTLILLVVLSMLGYTLSSRLAAQRHRDQYIIDYQIARYSCDSAVKYALATLEDIDSSQLIERPNEPDFSDLFHLDDAAYEKFLADWAAENILDKNKRLNDANSVKNVNSSLNDFNNLLKDFDEFVDSAGLSEPDLLTVRGPYGPSWPYVAEPVEFQIGAATVKIEIEDENAKYPLSWALLGENEGRREALAGLETFCEWMGVGYGQIDSLKSQLSNVAKIKTVGIDQPPEKTDTTPPRMAAKGRRERRGRAARVQPKRIVISPAMHTANLAQLFHSSLIDTEALAKPTVISERRKESALKYMGIWASKQVNINTAPRHVLEAAFTFGGDADKIAEEIIQRRRIKPFESIDELRKLLLRYSDSVGKCEKYVTTRSDFFTIRVTATSGVATASAVIAVTKDGKKIEKIAVISG